MSHNTHAIHRNCVTAMLGTRKVWNIGEIITLFHKIHRELILRAQLRCNRTPFGSIIDWIVFCQLASGPSSVWPKSLRVVIWMSDFLNKSLFWASRVLRSNRSMLQFNQDSSKTQELVPFCVISPFPFTYSPSTTIFKGLTTHYHLYIRPLSA